MTQAQLFAQLTEFWNGHIPFTQSLGMRVTRFDPIQAEVRFPWDAKLVGNKMQGILQGGVTATALDLAGGVVAAANMLKTIEPPDLEFALTKLAKLGTIDLRTDYLRPGRGNEFITTAHIIRSGNKVCVTRMEMHNEQGEHIAFGTGTYLVG